MQDVYQGIGIDSLMRPSQARKSSDKKMKYRRRSPSRGSRGRSNSGNRQELIVKKRTQSAKSIEKINLDPIVDLMNGYPDAQALLRSLMKKYSKNSLLTEYVKELVDKKKTGQELKQDFINKLYFLGEFLSPGITSQSSTVHNTLDMDEQTQDEFTLEEIEKKLFEAIYVLNEESLGQLRNNGLYDANTIQAIVGLLMLLGVKERDAMNEEVYLRFMLNPEVQVEKIQAFPENVRNGKVRPQTIQTVSKYLKKLGDIELDGTNSQIYNFIEKGVEFYEAFNNVLTVSESTVGSRVRGTTNTKDNKDVILVGKQDVVRTHCFDNPLNGLRRGVNGMAKLSMAQKKAYIKAVEAQTKKRTPSPAKRDRLGSFRSEARSSYSPVRHSRQGSLPSEYGSSPQPVRHDISHWIRSEGRAQTLPAYKELSRSATIEESQQTLTAKVEHLEKIVAAARQSISEPKIEIADQIRTESSEDSTPGLDELLDKIRVVRTSPSPVRNERSGQVRASIERLSNRVYNESMSSKLDYSDSTQQSPCISPKRQSFLEDTVKKNSFLEDPLKQSLFSDDGPLDQSELNDHRANKPPKARSRASPDKPNHRQSPPKQNQRQSPPKQNQRQSPPKQKPKSTNNSYSKISQKGETQCLIDAYTILEKHKTEITKIQRLSVSLTKDRLFEKIVEENKRFADDLGKALYGKPI